VAQLERDTLWFYAKRGRARRCGITVDALRFLAAEMVRGSASLPPRVILARHKEWLRALALLELAERDPADTRPLVLSEAHVRFQLASEETPDLPDVLCI
jgi:hypothetical protein